MNASDDDSKREYRSIGKKKEKTKTKTNAKARTKTNAKTKSKTKDTEKDLTEPKIERICVGRDEGPVQWWQASKNE